MKMEMEMEIEIEIEAAAMGGAVQHRRPWCEGRPRWWPWWWLLASSDELLCLYGGCAAMPRWSWVVVWVGAMLRGGCGGEMAVG